MIPFLLNLLSVRNHHKQVSYEHNYAQTVRFHDHLIKLLLLQSVSSHQAIRGVKITAEDKFPK